MLDPVDVTPGSVASVFSLHGSIVGSLSILVASLGGSSTVSGRGRSADVVARELSSVLTGEGDELVLLGALWDLDSVLVQESLQIGVRPRVVESIGEAGRCRSGGCRNRRVGGRGIVARDTGVAANRRDELVAS